ncbi:hypothetical protein BC939DRAFT_477460 [Gamsiella multidivaricata]|uniref:uncharacterized protein n=1 Tax=Gamsiella multidivaricata TaxID=101098 RepID=UPI00221EFE47|nr:uncharacterized protein BC939DRAFT_477460 [Gamsiella multidivaricata]KAI7823035.1 hypothetical protein BC939DRAFT_477460 [Gamsiella multidivaricata]
MCHGACPHQSFSEATPSSPSPPPPPDSSPGNDNDHEDGDYDPGDDKHSKHKPGRGGGGSSGKTWNFRALRSRIQRGFSLAIENHLDDEEEMLTEVAAYKALEDIQGDSIPRFKIGGYYGGIFSIATEVAGSPLEVDKLSQEERWKIVDKLSLIHMHGVLHNDIRPENILVRHGGNGI